ncbi:MAG: TonB-dependent receptor [Opitutae bacterium]|nr:TonB-dependent receptor [Opitutae bacterium]
MKNLLSFSVFFGGALFASAQTAPADPASEPKVKLGEFVVTASPLSRAIDEIAQPATVLGGPQLDLAKQLSLGETLAQQPGVTSTYFGPSASRPVIRGMGSDRIRVLSGGVGTMDASVVSPDHAVSLDPLLIDRIELVRGPAALLYGGSAIGGIVNVVDSRIPEEKPAHVFEGRIETRYGSAADERAGAAVLTGAVGDWAWRLDGFKRRSDDVRIPGYAATDAKRAELAAAGEPVVSGTLVNSASDGQGAGIGLTRFFGDAGHFGVSYNGVGSHYGTVAEPDVTIDLRQRRWDFHGEALQPTDWLRAAKFQLGLSRYQHTEFEGADVGTVFKNRGYEGRLELMHATVGPLTGAIGFQASRSDFSTTGEEAILPASLTTNRAVFLYEEIVQPGVTWEFGARAEQQRLAPRADATFAGRRDTLAAFSAGAVWKLPADYSLALSLTDSERAPNAQELFVDGPHAGTGAFEVGDATLRSEKVRGADLTLRKRVGFWSGSVTAFVNRFDGFIFEEATGTTDADSGLPVYEFKQGAARFHGAELELTAHLFETKTARAELHFTADTVRADNLDTRQPLPRIPPSRFGAALDYRVRDWTFTAELRTAARQEHIAPNETDTAGYGLASASIARRFKLGGVRGELFARGTNLTDATARVHTSFLKDMAPLPGRDVTAGVRFEF